MLERGDACRRRKQARPRELLDAALGLFIEKGFAAARAEDIAARAGVSKATLYLHFRSKEDLLKALIAERFASRIATVSHETTDAGASHDLLREVLTTWQSALMEGHAGGIFKLVLTEVHNFPGLADFWSHEVVEPARRRVAGIVVRGIDRGEFRPVDPDLVVHALVLPILIMCLHRHAMGSSVPDDALMNAPDLFSHHLEFVLEGLTPHPPARALATPASSSYECGESRSRV
ncbi:TetR/AcrR family transcriptional regulator [Variovorax paradoxus]|nr:TetR/AcrR family transcriptional regulator [Variovorax paradoxus]MBT2303876.1 TetR/AcrR family transcriptional regulator [Variovorax paradoxus]